MKEPYREMGRTSTFNEPGCSPTPPHPHSLGEAGSGYLSDTLDFQDSESNTSSSSSLPTYTWSLPVNIWDPEILINIMEYDMTFSGSPQCLWPLHPSHSRYAIPMPGQKVYLEWLGEGPQALKWICKRQVTVFSPSIQSRFGVGHCQTCCRKTW